MLNARNSYVFYTIEEVTVQFVPAAIQYGGTNESFGRNQVCFSDESSSLGSEQDFMHFSGVKNYDPL